MVRRTSLLGFVLALGAYDGACGGSDDGAKPYAAPPDGGGGVGGGTDAGGLADGASGPSDAGSGVDGDVAVLDAKPRCTPGPNVHDDLTSLPQPPPPPSGPDVTFLNDWSQNPATGGWKRSQIIDACRFHADGKTWHGKASARVEVLPGDDPLALGAGTERAEMLMMQDPTGSDIVETSATGEMYYATSYYFPPTWDGTFLRGDDNSWSFVWQLYPWGGLAAGRRGPTEPQGYFMTLGGTELAFAGGGKLALGKWTDLVLKVVWSTGAVVIWRRDEGEAAFAKVVDGIGGVISEDGTTMKQGLYRGGHVNGRVDVLWIGPAARGKTFSFVEQAAFGTKVGPP
jgi:hypothetical protein